MDLQTLFQSYKPALVRITVQTPIGDLSTGTAFNIGDGWLVTAAHVMRDGVVQEVVYEYASMALAVQSVIYNKDDCSDLAFDEDRSGSVASVAHDDDSWLSERLCTNRPY